MDFEPKKAQEGEQQAVDILVGKNVALVKHYEKVLE